jgi:hypothetical protein
MSFAITRTNGTGGTPTFAIGFSYRDETDLIVKVNGVTQTLNTHFRVTTGGTIIDFSQGSSPLGNPPNGHSIFISRATSQTSRLVDYAAGSVFKEADLDTDSEQAFFMAQEAIDIANDAISLDANNLWDANNTRITNVADPVDNQDAVNKQFISTNIPNITAVAGLSTQINSLAGITTELTRLGTTDAVSDINTLGSAATVTDMDTLANISTDITTLAHIEDGTTATNAIQTVATNISSVQSAQANATAAEAARDSAKAISAAMGAALDSFDDRYLGTMADTATAPTSKTPTITTTNGSADIIVSDATGLSIGMLVTSANIPAGTNVAGISGTTVSLSNSATAAGSGTSSTFAGHGVFGTFNSSTDGPATDNDNGTLVTGALYFNTTDNEMRVYDGGNWIAASAAGSASMTIFEYTVSTSPTDTFSGADDNGLTLSYTQDNIIVVKNGVTLHDDDYNSTTGTSIVLTSNAAVGSEIVIYAFKSFSVADTVSKASGGNFLGNIQINGADVATTGKAIAMAIVFGG